MNQEILLTALTDISDHYIKEAAPKRTDDASLRILLRIAACAAALVLTIGGVSAAGVYAKPVSYISLNVNPSIDLCLNKWNRVIDISAYNEEAAAICSNHSLKHRDYLDVVEELMCDPTLKALCADTDYADLTLTIVSEHYEQLAEEISACEAFAENNGEICRATEETARCAHEANCSIGKYAAYEELHSCGSTLSPEDCSQMTMHELNEAIRNHHEHLTESHSGEHHAETLPDEHPAETTSADHHPETTSADHHPETTSADHHPETEDHLSVNKEHHSEQKSDHH